MTKLAATEKSSGIIKRETGTQYRGRAIMVEMRPPSIIAVRLKGMRREYVVNAITVFELAVKIAAAGLARAKVEARKAKRAARIKGL